MRKGECKRYVDADLRAIGRFVVEFGQLVFHIRKGILFHVGGPAHQPQPLNLLMGEATAKPLSNAFFAMLRGDESAPPEGEDLRMLGRIENEVGEVITLRNDVMHGDWFVGYAEEGANRPGPATLMRTKPGRRTGAALEVRELTTDDIEDLTERVSNARRLVQEVGTFMLDRALRRQVYGELGLAEVFEIVHGRPQHREGAPGFKFE